MKIKAAVQVLCSLFSPMTVGLGICTGFFIPPTFAADPSALAVTCAPVPSGLVGWWRGEGNANDEMGVNNGIALGDVTYVSGEVGQGFNFNGVDGRIVISNSPSLNLSSEITVEGWFLSRRWSPDGYGIYSKRDASGKANYALNVSSAYGFDVYFNDFAVNDGDFGSDFEISAFFPTPTLNIFHHFASTFRQADPNHVALETYLDGVLVTNKTKLGSLAQTLNTAPLVIGTTFTSQPFDGVIDEISLYNRVLTGPEIAGIYSAASTGKCPSVHPPPPNTNCIAAPAGLVALWPFDNDLSDTIGNAQASASGNPSFVQGEVKGALNFDGVSDSVTVSAMPLLNVGQGSGMTLEGWIKPGTVAYQQPIAEWNDGAGNIRAHLWISVGNAAEGSLYANLIDVSGVSHQIWTAPGLLTAGAYSHVAVTYDKSSGAATLFVDGSSVTRSNIGSFTPDTRGNLYLGFRPSGTAAGNRYTGALDELSLYNRALNPAEIEGVFLAGAAGKCTPPPIPPGPAAFDVSQDFDKAHNPSGVWSFGWKPTTTGLFTLFSDGHAVPSQEGYMMDTWSAGNGAAEVQHNGTPYTMTTDGTAGVFPPGTVVMNPGSELNSIADNFSVIRFTAPSNGNYQVDTAVHTYLDGSISGDSDFHIVKSNEELFGRAIPGNGGAEYSGLVNLAAGQTLDFLCGLGADGRQYASGLKIACQIAFVNSTSNSPPPMDTNCVAAPSGLVGWWPGEGNANDVLARNNGNIVGNVTFAPGKVGQGFNFTGNGQVSIPNAPSLNFSNEVTVECWFLSRRWGPDGYGIVAKRDDSGKANYAVNASELYGFDIYFNDFSVNDGDFGSDFEILAYSSLPTLNAFHHLAATFKQQDTDHVRLETYIDGVLVTNKTKLGNLARTINAAPFTIGSSGPSQFFDGIIDEVSLYSRALNASEVAALYAAGANGKCPVPPIPAPGTYDITRDFDKANNPSGVWSFGWKPTVTGLLTLFTDGHAVPSQEGYMMDTWSAGNGAAEVQHNGTAFTMTTDGSAGVFPPGTVIMNPGSELNSIADNFSVIRFTAPSNGNYQVDAAVHTYLDGTISGDTDFHVVKGLNELFGQFIPGNGGTSFSQPVNLAQGESLDFLCGLGADGRQYASGLKIACQITFLNGATNPPPPIESTNGVPAGAGLVGWWPAEGNANDVIGGNNGVELNGVTYAPGKVGLGFNLNGAGARVLVPNSPALNITNEITIESWFLSRKWGPGGFGICSKRDGAGKANYGVNASTLFGFDLYYNDPSVNDGDFGSDYEISAYTPLPSLNEFHHFAATFKQVDSGHVRMETYLDGDLVTNKTERGNLASTVNTAPLMIGSTGPVDSFDGIIDEFSIYNRVLTAGQVNAIFHGGAVGKHRRDVVPIGHGSASLVKHASGHCEVTFDLQSDGNYVVEASEDLQNWVPVSGVVSGNGIITVEDPAAASCGHRFYRVRAVP